MTRFFGWPSRGRRDRQADLADLLELPPDCADEAELLDGRPCCCQAENGSGIHDGECCVDCCYDDGDS